jgi:hypothetical protein
MAAESKACNRHTVEHKRHTERKPLGLLYIDVSNTHTTTVLQLIPSHTAKTISKQIFPEKEHRGLSPNFHFHASVSDLYIPTTGLPILLDEICRPILGLYKSLTDT